MADEPLSTQELKLREAAKLMGMLFVGRRDSKAVFTNGQWIAKREKYTLSDFRSHLYGDRCLGAYLLDPDSMVRCIAFDIDLKDDGDYFLIDDAEVDLVVQHHGNLEAALHDADNPAHPWACSLVSSTATFLKREIYDALALCSTVIVTGGGAHVFVPFGTPLPAAEARAMAHSVMDGIPTFARRSENFYGNDVKSPSIEIEVFPKQDALTDSDSLGNLIRLPFGHHECGIRTYALDTSNPMAPSWNLPKADDMDALRLAAAMVDLEWEILE